MTRRIGEHRGHATRSSGHGFSGRGLGERIATLPRRLVVATRAWLTDAWSELRSRRALRRWSARMAWGWSVLVVVAWLLLITTSEKFLPATMLAYGPRFVMLAPFVILVPLAAATARRTLVPLMLSLLVVIGPIMGGRLSWRTTLHTPADVSAARRHPRDVLQCRRRRERLEAPSRVARGPSARRGRAAGMRERALGQRPGNGRTGTNREPAEPALSVAGGSRPSTRCREGTSRASPRLAMAALESRCGIWWRHRMDRWPS